MPISLTEQQIDDLIMQLMNGTVNTMEFEFAGEDGRLRLMRIECRILDEQEVPRPTTKQADQKQRPFYTGDLSVLN